MKLIGIVSGFIGFVFVMILLIWFIIAVVITKGCNAIQDKGLKGVVTDIWEGPNTSNIVIHTSNSTN